MSTVTQENLSRELDAVERNARGQLIADDRSSAMQRHLAWVMWLLPVVPALAVIWQLVRWTSGEPAGWFSLLGLSVAAMALPAAALMIRTYSGSAFVNRKRALIAMDRTLGSADRLATADEFLQTDSPNGFQQAAIEDASTWVANGRIANIASHTTPAKIGRQLGIAAPISIALVLAALGLSHLERTQSAAPRHEEPTAAGSVATAEHATSAQPEPAPEVDPPKKEAALPAKDGKQPSKRVAAPVSSIPDEAEESQGKLAEGESSESQQSSNPSNAQGAPSSQGQPSKATDKQEKKKKNKQKPKKNDRETKKQEKKEEEPSGATAGQGSSRGNSNNAAANDWSSKTQQSTPDEEDPDSDEDAEDDDEEQESRGGVQPNMRDRRSPVNRDLNIGLGNARPNPDANGRGGPGGQKKSRGVASLILGVPIPDRITGQPNKGRTRITQQRITPEAEDTTPVPAEDRGRRNGAVGPIHHPDFAPWLQNHVKNYFLKRRAAASQKKDEGTTSRDGTASKPVGHVTPKLPAGDA